MQKGREDKERVRKFTERGIILNQNHKLQMPVSRPQASTTKQSRNVTQLNSPNRSQTNIGAGISKVMGNKHSTSTTSSSTSQL